MSVASPADQVVCAMVRKSSTESFCIDEVMLGLVVARRLGLEHRSRNTL